MIRKLLVVAAAVAMPAAALAAVTTVGTSGVAGAAKVYKTQTCAITGGVTFAPPGLSYLGTIGKKTTTTVTASSTFTGTGCGPKATPTTSTLALKITSAATDCKTAPTPVPPGCTALETSKDFYLFDTASSFAGSGVSSIVASLSKGIKLIDNGNVVKGVVTTGGTSLVVAGVCGTGNAGFQLTGSTNVTGLSYDVLLCITSDTGPGTSGQLGADAIAASGGNEGITIATGGFGAPSALTFTYAP